MEGPLQPSLDLLESYLERRQRLNIYNFIPSISSSEKLLNKIGYGRPAGQQVVRVVFSLGKDNKLLIQQESEANVSPDESFVLVISLDKSMTPIKCDCDLFLANSKDLRYKAPILSQYYLGNNDVDMVGLAKEINDELWAYLFAVWVRLMPDSDIQEIYKIYPTTVILPTFSDAIRGLGTVGHIDLEYTVTNKYPKLDANDKVIHPISFFLPSDEDEVSISIDTQRKHITTQITALYVLEELYKRGYVAFIGKAQYGEANANDTQTAIEHVESLLSPQGPTLSILTKEQQDDYNTICSSKSPAQTKIARTKLRGILDTLYIQYDAFMTNTDLCKLIKGKALPKKKH